MTLIVVLVTIVLLLLFLLSIHNFTKCSSALQLLDIQLDGKLWSVMVPDYQPPAHGSYLLHCFSNINWQAYLNSLFPPEVYQPAVEPGDDLVFINRADCLASSLIAS